MKTVKILLLAIFIAVILQSASAVSLDVTKTDIIINAKSKDLSPVVISISVEWQSNVSVTSQDKSNIRAMTEMAVIEEVRKYDIDILEPNKLLIEENIKSSIENKAQNVDISISDIEITKITDKNKLAVKTTPEKIEVAYIPFWIYFLILVAFAIGYFIGIENRKKN